MITWVVKPVLARVFSLSFFPFVLLAAAFHQFLLTKAERFVYKAHFAYGLKTFYPAVAIGLCAFFDIIMLVIFFCRPKMFKWQHLGNHL